MSETQITNNKSKNRKLQQDSYKEYNGPYIRYDLVKEVTIALVIVIVLTFALAIVFSSPDDSPVTIKSWSQNDPIDFVTTAISELDGSSLSSSYGPPYNNGTGAQQKLGSLAIEKWAGVTTQVNSAQDFVLNPLSTLNPDENLVSALHKWNESPSTTQNKWMNNYSNALGGARYLNNTVVTNKGDYGPLPLMMSDLLALGQNGALDTALTGSTNFYGTDYTKPLLFIADGSYFSEVAQAKHLQGNQWGMMNETGNWPGQAWLWLYTLWYQIPPYTHTGNADAWVMVTMTGLSLFFIFFPFIPGLRKIPEKLPIHKIIWRRWYKEINVNNSKDT